MAACLQIIQPGGIFLSAPYAESTTAALSFTSLIFFVKSFPLFGQASAVHDFSLLIAGVGLGLGTTVRSNVLLYGMLFVEEAGRLVWSLKDGITYAKIRRGIFTGLGGLCIAAGFIYPQWIAYNQFCVPHRGAREWCMKAIPGIYAFVQVRYWFVSHSPSLLPNSFLIVKSADANKGPRIPSLLEGQPHPPLPPRRADDYNPLLLRSLDIPPLNSRNNSANV